MTTSGLVRPSTTARKFPEFGGVLDAAAFHMPRATSILAFRPPDGRTFCAVAGTADEYPQPLCSAPQWEARDQSGARISSECRTGRRFRAPDFPPARRFLEVCIAKVPEKGTEALSRSKLVAGGPRSRATFGRVSKSARERQAERAAQRKAERARRQRRQRLRRIGVIVLIVVLLGGALTAAIIADRANDQSLGVSTQQTAG